MIYEARVNNTPDIDYLKDMSPSNTIPSYASIHEMAYYVIEKSESDFNDMMMNIGINELNYFIDNGTEIVYEANEDGKNPVSKLGETVINWLKARWSDFVGMIEKALDYIDKKIDSIKTGAFNHMVKAVDINTIDDKKDFGKTFEFVADSSTEAMERSLNDHQSSLDDLFDRYQSFLKSGDTVEDFTKECESVRNDFIKFSTGKDYTEKMNIKDEFKLALQGKEITINGAWVKSNWSDLQQTVIKGNDSKKAIQKIYNNMKKSYNKCIINTKKVTTSIKETANNIKLYSALNKELKNLIDLAFMYTQSSISTIVASYNFSYRLALKLCSSAKIAGAKNAVKGAAKTVSNQVAGAKEAVKDKVGNKKETVQHNSAMMESNSITVDRLTSLFDW